MYNNNKKKSSESKNFDGTGNTDSNASTGATRMKSGRSNGNSRKSNGRQDGNGRNNDRATVNCDTNLLTGSGALRLPPNGYFKDASAFILDTGTIQGIIGELVRPIYDSILSQVPDVDFMLYRYFDLNFTGGDGGPDAASGNLESFVDGLYYVIVDNYLATNKRLPINFPTDVTAFRVYMQHVATVYINIRAVIALSSTAERSAGGRTALPNLLSINDAMVAQMSRLLGFPLPPEFFKALNMISGAFVDSNSTGSPVVIVALVGDTLPSGSTSSVIGRIQAVIATELTILTGALGAQNQQAIVQVLAANFGRSDVYDSITCINTSPSLYYRWYWAAAACNDDTDATLVNVEPNILNVDGNGTQVQGFPIWIDAHESENDATKLCTTYWGPEVVAYTANTSLQVQRIGVLKMSPTDVSYVYRIRQNGVFISSALTSDAQVHSTGEFGQWFWAGPAQLSTPSIVGSKVFIRGMRYAEVSTSTMAMQTTYLLNQLFGGGTRNR